MEKVTSIFLKIFSSTAFSMAAYSGTFYATKAIMTRYNPKKLSEQEINNYSNIVAFVPLMASVFASNEIVDKKVDSFVNMIYNKK